MRGPSGGGFGGGGAMRAPSSGGFSGGAMRGAPSGGFGGGAMRAPSMPSGGFSGGAHARPPACPVVDSAVTPPCGPAPSAAVFPPTPAGLRSPAHRPPVLPCVRLPRACLAVARCQRPADSQAPPRPSGPTAAFSDRDRPPLLAHPPLALVPAAPACPPLLPPPAWCAGPGGNRPSILSGNPRSSALGAQAPAASGNPLNSGPSNRIVQRPAFNNERPGASLPGASIGGRPTLGGTPGAAAACWCWSRPTPSR